MDSLDPRVEAVFLAVLEVDPAERSILLETRTEGQPDLRRAVEVLLAQDDDHSGFDVEATRLVSVGLSRPQEVEVGGRIGPYRVRALLGEGGMGRVYRAEQTEPIRREVALKVIKAGMDTHAVLRRFEAERQMLALMDHPSIARVFEAGASESGRSYFAMEVVDGPPITEFCDQRRLAVRDRVRLFLRVLSAVHHAHQKGIIHRDLKPSNILVTESDEGPTPKVIDFGVSKALHTPLVEAATRTGAGILVGTPAYMSPEQADPDNPDVDTRSDVYSLGVVLYELLSGATPLDPSSVTLNAANLGRVIQSQDPEAPSSRVKIGGSTDSTVAESRGTTVRSLSGQLVGDLDWIVLKALEADRDRRYSSVRELYRDLERYLYHQPVEASPPSVLYRLRKFCRRRRDVMGIAALVAVGVIYALVVGWLAYRETERQRAIADGINRFFDREILYQADPDNALGPQITLREVLDRASDRIAGRFDDQPEVEVKLRDTIGRAYRGLGEIEPATDHLIRACSLASEVYGAGDERTLRIHLSLGNLERQRGKPEAARFHLEAALAGYLAGYDHHPEVGPVYTQLAGSYRDEDRLEEAQAMLERAVEALRHPAVEPADRVKAENELGLLLLGQGKTEEGLIVMRSVAAKARAQLPPNHPHRVIYLMNLGLACLKARCFDEAEALYTETLEIARATLGEKHSTTLVNRYHLGTVYMETGRYDEAEAELRRAWERGREHLGERHPRVGAFASGLGNALAHLERLSEAEARLLEAHVILTESYSDDHVWVKRVRERLANLYERWERPAEAQIWRERAGSEDEKP